MRLFTIRSIKKQLHAIVHIIMFLIVANIGGTLRAQPLEVQRSSEKILLNGKAFFVHTVKKSETLYSIAKAYGISVGDIINANPSLGNEIKPDQILKIPESDKPADNVQIKKTNGEVIHIVAAKQTLFSIAKMYGVSVKAIEENNPEVAIDSIQVNQILKIPVLNSSANKPTSENATYFIHKVEEKETLYSLSKTYSTTQDALLALNDNIAKDGLKKGMEIKIPKPSGNSTQAAANKPDTIAPKQPATSVSVATSDTATCSKLTGLPGNEIRIALLLPLFSSGAMVTDSETAEDAQNEEKIQAKQPDEFNPIAVNFLEFYQGVLLAVDHLKKHGYKILLNVYDVEKDNKKINEILKNEDFKSSNLIIGPVYNEQMKIVSDYALENKICLISPFSNQDELLVGNPFMFQINPGKQAELEASIELLKSDSAQNIVIVYNSALDNPNKYDKFKAYLANTLGERINRVKEVTIYSNDFKTVKDNLDSLQKNFVISPVEDEIFVTNLLSTLESKLVDFNIHLIGLSEWLKYKGIDMNYLYDQQFTYNTPFYYDFNNEYTRDFLKKYRLFFGTEPYKSSKYGFNYSMLGYDVSNYFIKAYASYNISIFNCSTCIKTPLLSPFQFTRSGNGNGLINANMQTIRYQRDYKLIRLDK